MARMQRLMHFRRASMPGVMRARSVVDCNSQRRRRRISGFTLVEILIVLVIVAMLAGVSLPRLLTLYESVENSATRNAIRDQIEGLGYRAYTTGKPIVLEASSVSDGRVKDYPLQLPPGWRVDVSQPLRYSPHGYCGGGKVIINDPNGGTQAFNLVPPRCRFQAAPSQS